MSRECFSCAINLTYGVYYSKSGQSYCFNCYEAQHCKTCIRCKQKVKAEQRGLTWSNTTWHHSCFNCTNCNESLVQQSSSFERNNLPYCSNCYNLLFSPKCAKCGGIIESGTSWLNEQDKKIHPRCFTCSQCNAALANKTYYDHNGMPYCPDCDTQFFCPKCAWCDQVIYRGTTYLTMDGQKIHNTCFTCSACGGIIHGVHQKKNGGSYHPECVDNSYFRQRRMTFHETNNNDRTHWDQSKNTRKAADNHLTTITPLNLRSSTAKNIGLHRSTTNLPNLLQTTTQSNNDILPQSIQQVVADTTQDNTEIKKLPDFIASMFDRARTAASRRLSVVDTEQKVEKETTENPSQTIQPDKHLENQRRSQSTRRRASIPSNVPQNMASETIHSDPKPPKPAPRKTRTCQVCYEEKSVTLYSQPISYQCRHRERTICNSCVYQHITHAFGKMCTDDVRCPELDCGIILDYDAIKKILLDSNDNNLFERYDRFYLEHQLERMPDFIWCAHGCGSGQLADHGATNNIITCAKCRKKSCFTHRTQWHEGLTCENYDEQTDPGRRATEQWLAQKTKACPNCQSSIEKTTGCDHMTCARCHFEFCWSCLANYASIRQHGNHYHHDHCKHYRPYRP